MVDAYEEQKVVVADVAGAYLSTFIDAILHINFINKQVEVMILIDLSYEDFVMIKNKKKVLYLKLAKALCSCVYLALL